MIKKKILFNFLVSFRTELDENGSMTQNVMCDKIYILYYFNDENIDLEKMLFLLKEFAKTYGLNSQGWKHLPAMAVSDSKHQNYDYFKRIEFMVRKWLLFLFLALQKPNKKQMNFKEFFVHYENVLDFHVSLKKISKQIITKDQERTELMFDLDEVFFKVNS